MGEPYPLWIEKVIFVGILSLTIYFGIQLKGLISGFLLWLSWLCLLPLMAVVFSEMLGRAIQNLYSK